LASYNPPCGAETTDVRAADRRRRCVLPVPVVIAIITLLAWANISANDEIFENHAPERSVYRAPLAHAAPRIDGAENEPAWERAEWRAIDAVWLGERLEADDFSGRFKVLWTPSRLYLLVEIVDDVLRDTHRDPLTAYWDDDCLEIFLDEDFSGGDHQYNHNAFAYHLALDNRAIDIGTDRRARDYSHHVESHWRQYDGHLLWEVAIDVYADDYVDGGADNQPVALTAGKVLGLMVAYCDNDASELREHFVGSEVVPSGPKDRGWIDAGLFGALKLVN